jgi:hypothetical protein
MEIINKTPHEVVLLDPLGNVILTFPKADSLIRLSSTTVRDEPLTVLLNCPISRTVFGNPIGLPEQQVGIFYIVSQLVKSALPDRADLLVPAEMVRDENGNIKGCRSLGF